MGMEQEFREHVDVFGRSRGILEQAKKAADEIIKCFEAGNKVLIFGNGGSAADAQHFAAELAGRYRKRRNSLPAIALTTNSSTLTAIGNDFGFERIFENQIEALGREGDVAVGISTGGNSESVLNGVARAKETGLKTIGFTGSGGKLKEAADIAVCVPSGETPRVQEMHMFMLHAICGAVEEHFAGK